MAEQRAIDDDVTAAALEFTILTAARTSEVVGAVWKEVDFDARTWTIPAARMGKNGKEQRIPLSDRAAAILKTMAEIRIDSRVFPGLGQWAMLPLLQRRLKHPNFTVHGFRSSFRDWAGEQTNFPRELAEAALAHYAGGTEGAYARGDLFPRRRKLIAAGAAVLPKPPTTRTLLTMKAVGTGGNASP